MLETACPAATRPPTERILGLEFFTGTLAEAGARIAGGGLLTAPAGPGLAWDFVREPAYRAALERSDVVLTDSGFLVLLWLLRTGRRLPRHSGLKFLRAWLQRDVMRRPGAVRWVMPGREDLQRTQAWLRAHAYPVAEDDFEVASFYGAGPIADPGLAARIERQRPAVVYLGIGGGVQERLGHYLRDRLSYRPAILCLGAALAFLTGAQVHIPPWVDRAGLGWLWRIGADPGRYSTRYLRATRLAWLVFRHGAAAPPLRPVGPDR